MQVFQGIYYIGKREGMFTMFRKFALIMILVVWGGVLGFAFNSQGFVKNADKPLAKNAGRTVQLQEIMAIRDVSEAFYLKAPELIKVMVDGSFFVFDDEQLLKFDRIGKYEFNLYQKGQGPFELTFVQNLLIDKERLIVHDSGQGRVLVFDYRNGARLEEFRYRLIGSVKMLTFVNGYYYFFHVEKGQDTHGKMKMVDLKASIMRFMPGKNEMERVYSFPVSFLVIQSGDQHAVMPRAKFNFCLYGVDRMFFTHTGEYDIKCFDFRTQQVVKRFTRQYKRVRTSDELKKYTPGGGIEHFSLSEGGPYYTLPTLEYLIDIQQLMVYKNRLWVMTSTVNGKNQVLVDVFDFDGRYVDNFYLSAPSVDMAYRTGFWVKAADGACLFLCEEDEEGQKIIRKCNLSQY